MGTRIRVGDLEVKCYKGVKKIREHPYYISLKYNCRNTYENYVNKSYIQREKESGSWRGYNKLKNKVEKLGFIYNRQDGIIVEREEGKWRVCHGRHRACILRYLYGRECVIVVKKIGSRKYIVKKVETI